MDYLKLGKEPVPGDQNTGEDIRYEDDFEALQQEIDKLSSLTERESFSWDKVVESSAEILEKRSKDLLVAAYLSTGLLYVDKETGIYSGTLVLKDILENFWEDLFPVKKRLKGRLAAIEWWAEKTEAAFDGGFCPVLKQQEIDKILGNLDSIDDFLIEKAKAETAVYKVRDKIRSLRPAEEENTSEIKPQQESPPQTTPQNNASDSSIDINLTNASDVKKGMTQIFQKIRQASKILRDEKKENPEPYKWIRFALWEGIKKLPDSSDYVTKIPSPDKKMIKRLDDLLNDQDWDELLTYSESCLNNPRNIFLLDLNMYSFTALSNLGKKFNGSKKAVISETLWFVSRLEGIEDLMFSDKMPFASDDTKTWINEISKISEGEAGNIQNSVSGFSEEINEIIDSAKEEIEDNLYNGIGFLESKINEARSGKKALLLRLELVNILASEKKDKLIYPHLDLILNEIEEHKIYLWEPDIAVSALKIVYKWFKKLNDKNSKEKTERVFGLLVKISTKDSLKL